MSYTFPTTSYAEPFNNPYNPDYLSRRWRAQQSGSLPGTTSSFGISMMPTSSSLTEVEYKYFYSGSDTR